MTAAAQTLFGLRVNRRQSRGAAAGAERRQSHYLPDAGTARLLHHPCRHRGHILFQGCGEKQPLHAGQCRRHGLRFAQIDGPGIDALGLWIGRQATPGHGAHRGAVFREQARQDTAHGPRGAGHQNGSHLAHGVRWKALRWPPDATGDAVYPAV